ncbi:uncharacterized protein LOC131669740 [Phymastichus coffea]|uniref:uncharacterized protein LOC131669740 n=1 Tax=Phymastichus coffea TaxID=108790 RepID=UPI00273C5C49|nr:uncharacterized protein LOC131669740 [Phymastichus coffea]
MTMNVLMAMQIFSARVSVAMEMYKDDEKLKDAGPTIAFIKKVKAVIDAMRSRTSGDALRINENRSRRQAIVSFITYLQEWKSKAHENNFKFPLTNNTYTGFIVTLKATLELLDYLNQEEGYKYLMTNCLCSDPIEVSLLSKRKNVE